LSARGLTGLLLAALSAPAGAVDLSDAPSAGEGAQSITLLLRDTPPGVAPRAVYGDDAVNLEPIGSAVHAGTLRAPPARVAAIQVLDVGTDPPTLLYDGMIALPDQRRSVLAFRFPPATPEAPPARTLERVPLAIEMGDTVALDQRVPFLVGMGWGLLVLLYVAALAGIRVLGLREAPPATEE
jgi:hypothetical protein